MKSEKKQYRIRLAEPNPGHGRRSFFARLGVGGLTAAVALFADARSAAALYSFHCCGLAYPTSCGHNYCMLNGEYWWVCSSGGWTCTCCEYYASACSSARCCSGHTLDCRYSGCNAC